jgi:hypothetical protein
VEGAEREADGCISCMQINICGPFSNASGCPSVRRASARARRDWRQIVCFFLSLSTFTHARGEPSTFKMGASFRPANQDHSPRLIFTILPSRWGLWWYAVWQESANRTGSAGATDCPYAMHLDSIHLGRPHTAHGWGRGVADRYIRMDIQTAFQTRSLVNLLVDRQR